HRRLRTSIGARRAAHVYFGDASRSADQREHFLVNRAAREDDQPPVRATGIGAEPLAPFSGSARAAARQDPIDLWNRRQPIDRVERVAQLIERTVERRLDGR